MNIINKTVSLPDGREISVETGKLAKQADGSVVVRMGNTMLLATVVSSKEAKEGVDFLPLSVDYQEKFAGGGKIPGGFLKREGRLSDHEVLVCRLVDRAIRPLFPDDYHADTQINISMISGERESLPDSLAAFAASCALSVSDIPYHGPISEVRVVRVDGEFIINPSAEQLESADLEMMVGATYEDITMVEGEMSEISEDDMIAAIKAAHDAIKPMCELQKELTIATGKEEKREYSHETDDEELEKLMFEKLYDKAYEVAARQSNNKSERSQGFKDIKEAFVAEYAEDEAPEADLVGKYWYKIQKKACRDMVLKEQARLDGRQFDEIRPIWCEIDYLPSAHGSAVFTRGETQSLTTMTLGTKLDEQMIDNALYKGFNKFILHYNFPGFSTGEVKPNRGPARREIGHGNLAHRAIKKVMPKDEDNPYTVRVVSDILESNGSSSMATVCAGTLALMDGGFPIKAPVSGIAMGMISDAETGKYAILSDILGDEDHLGDMDFKVTGTAKGITACQMDIKVNGLSYDVLKEALVQAKEGRLHILNIMTETIAEPRAELKPNAPRSVTVKIDRDMIGAVIGPGGKVVQEIQKETNTTVVIEEVEEGGLVNVFAVNQTDMDQALDRIKAIVSMPEVGETYMGKVKNIMPFGAFVEFLPGREGLLHISEIKWERVETMDGVFQVGEEVEIKLIDVDKKTGKYRLSRKALLPRPERQDRPQRSNTRNDD